MATLKWWWLLLPEEIDVDWISAVLDVTWAMECLAQELGQSR
jgi:hypothetical protein